jgi:hypothetical protein
MIKLMTYEQWLRNNPEIVQEMESSRHSEENQECPGCDGSGEVICTCEQCDNEHKRECTVCGGDGTLDKQQANLQWIKNKNFKLRQLYYAQREKDKDNLKLLGIICD